VGVQEDRWDKDGMKPAGESAFSYEKVSENHELDRLLFVHERIISAVKKVEFFGDRISYIMIGEC
jgi:hypothetical protein